MNEKEIVEKLFSLSSKIDEVTEKKKELEKEYDKLAYELHEHMVLNGLSKTGEYSGIGKIQDHVRTFASFKEENREKVYEWLKENGLGDIIKPYVHPSTFSALISDNIKEGRTYPEFINVFMKPSPKLIKSK